MAIAFNTWMEPFPANRANPCRLRLQMSYNKPAPYS